MSGLFHQIFLWCCLSATCSYFNGTILSLSRSISIPSVLCGAYMTFLRQTYHTSRIPRMCIGAVSEKYTKKEKKEKLNVSPSDIQIHKSSHIKTVNVE